MEIKYAENSSGFSEFDVERLKALAADKVWTDYHYEGYEGGGHLIAKRGDEYALHSCSHCSCYGPLEHLSPNITWHSSLDAAAESCSDYLREQLAPLLAIVRSEVQP